MRYQNHTMGSIEADEEFFLLSTSCQFCEVYLIPSANLQAHPELFCREISHSTGLSECVIEFHSLGNELEFLPESFSLWVLGKTLKIWIRHIITGTYDD